MAEEQKAKMERDESSRLSVMNSMMEHRLRDIGASDIQVQTQQEQSKKVCYTQEPVNSFPFTYICYLLYSEVKTLWARWAYIYAA